MLANRENGMGRSLTASLVVAALLGSLCGEASAANFTQVASFGSYGPWGACVWNDRIYVGFYVGHTDLPLYRSGVNDDSFSFVRNLGRGEALPRLWVSPDGTTLNAATEGLSGSETSPGVHWWTNDANAQIWRSETYGTASTTRGILAAGVYDGVEYQCTYVSNGPGKLFRNSGGWSQYGPNIAGSENETILELQYFNGQLYLGGGRSDRWTQPDCARVVRYTGSSWQQVFNQTAGLIASSAVFDGKLWMGSGSGTSRVYSTSNGTSWTQEYNFGLTGSWTSVEDMIVYNNRLWVAACNGDNSLKIMSKAAGGSFVSEYISSAYKSIGQFVIRGNDLYIVVERVSGGTAALKYTEVSDTQAPTVPTNVQALAQLQTSIQVTWTASTDNVGVTGYQVYRNGGPVGTAAATSYTDTGLTANTAYSYTVSAYDAAGNNSAQASPPATATTAHRGDFDGDGDVDGADYGVFAGCFNGSGNPINPGCSGADLNGDNAVDGIDYGLFAGCFNGTGNPPACQ